VPTSTSPDPVRRPTAGPPLHGSVTVAIRRAVLLGLATEGHGRLSMESVARRAGVGKAALYRRWPSKEEMVNDVVLEAVQGARPFVPDTGSLRSDVRELLLFFRSQLREPGQRRIAADLLAESTRNAELARILDDAVARPRRDALRALLVTAMDRGELPDDLDLDLAIELFVAPVALRILQVTDPLQEVDVDALTDVICAGLGAARVPARPATGPDASRLTA